MAIDVRPQKQINDKGEYAYFVSFQFLNKRRETGKAHSVFYLPFKIRNERDIDKLYDHMIEAINADVEPALKTIQGVLDITLINFFQVEADDEQAHAG